VSTLIEAQGVKAPCGRSGNWCCGDARDRTGDHVKRVMNAGMNARVGDKRRKRGERGRGPGRRCTGGSGGGKCRRRMSRRPGRRVGHRHLPSDPHAVRVGVWPPARAEWLEQHVHDSGGERDRGQAIRSGAATAPSAEPGHRPCRTDPELGVVCGSRKPSKGDVQCGGRRGGDPRIDRHIFLASFVEPARAGFCPAKGRRDMVGR
jgi:hypothetical protein